MASRIARILGPVLLLALLLSACGGGEETTPTGPEPAEDGQEQPAQGGGGDLEALAQAWMHTEAMIVYRQEASGGDGSVGDMTLYWSPPGSWRGDFESGGETSTVIVTPDHSYTCAAGSCFEIPSTGDDAGAPFFPGSFVDPTDVTKGLPEGANLETTSETIAGVEATCFTAAASQGGGQWCFSADGLLLRAAVSASGAEGGEYLLEAVEVSTSLPDDAFDPPFPVTELPEVPTG